MIIIKSQKEIEIMREAGKIVAETHEILKSAIIPGISTLELDKIAEENIRKYKPVFEATFDITIYEDEIVDVLLNSSNRGIETLAGTVYKYICDKIGSKWSTNDDIRLQDLLTCIAITTIFLDENGKKKVTR